MSKFRAILIAGVAVICLLATGYTIHRRDTLGVSQAAAPRALEAATTADTRGSVIYLVKNPEPVPPFLARDLDGKVISTATWQGKVTLLNFWATWCPPCRVEIPELIELQKQYKGKLQIIGVSEDEAPPEQVRKFAQAVGINYPVIMASPQLVEEFGGIPALPTNFVIDTKARVVQKHIGLYPMEFYEREVRALLGMPVDATIQTFEDTGQIFLKNAANATELPGVDLSHLTAEQKKMALKRLNSEGCTCGCGLTLAQCRINDTSCPISKKLAARVVEDIRRGKTPDIAAPKSN